MIYESALPNKHQQKSVQKKYMLVCWRNGVMEWGSNGMLE